MEDKKRKQRPMEANPLTTILVIFLLGVLLTLAYLMTDTGSL